MGRWGSTDRVGILLEEIFLDHLGYVKSYLARLIQRIPADELHDLRELLIHLEHLVEFGAQADELAVKRIVVGLEGALVLRVTLQPVDGREVLTLGQPLVETPEHLTGGNEGQHATRAP